MLRILCSPHVDKVYIIVYTLSGGEEDDKKRDIEGIAAKVAEDNG